MMRAIGVLFLLAAPGWSQSGQPAACALTSAQVGAALGVTVVEAKPGMSIPLGSGSIQDCRYKLKAGNRDFTLMLKTARYGSKASAAQHFDTLAGRLTAVPNDPDGARVQDGQGDATSPAVHYFRNGAGVELRLLGTHYDGLKPSPAEIAAWQKKLLALPRIP